MSLVYPALKTGALAQYPAQFEESAAARVIHFLDGSQQAVPTRGVGKRRWELAYQWLDEGEMQQLASFFQQCQGRANSFSFTDPWTGEVVVQCVLASDSLVVTESEANRFACRIALEEFTERLMIVFPQLGSGAVGQLPLVKTVAFQTTVNEFADGTTRRVHELIKRIRWSLDLRELTTQEINALMAFGVRVSGSTVSFAWMDPYNNLLAWSESLVKAVWKADATLQVALSAAGPPAEHSIRNVGQTKGSLEQTIACPSGYGTEFSLEAKSASATTPLTLYRGSSSATVSTAFVVGTSWTPVSLVDRGSGSDDTSRFGITVPAGAVVSVRKVQVCPQSGTRAYYPTQTESGIYANCRLSDGAFGFTGDGPNRFHTRMAVETEIGLNG